MGLTPLIPHRLHLEVSARDLQTKDKVDWKRKRQGWGAEAPSSEWETDRLQYSWWERGMGVVVSTLRWAAGGMDKPGCWGFHLWKGNCR